MRMVALAARTMGSSRAGCDMKRVNFLHMTIRDFKSFLGEHQFTFDLATGVWFIRGRNRKHKRMGSNGSGKSTLWDAVVWCLFGVTPSGLRNPDVTPWKGMKRGTRVQLLVEINGKRRTIERRISPNALTIDGRDVGPEAVVRLIGMTFELMTNTIILGQGRDLFYDMTPANKMQLLSDAQQLERWDVRSKAAAGQARELEQEYATITGEITGLTAAVKEFRDGMKSLRDQADAWQQEYEKRVANAQKVARRGAKRVEELTNECARLDLKYDSAMTEVKACERDIEKMHGQMLELNHKLDRKLHHRKQLNANLDALNKQYQSLRDAKRCPTCGQAIVPGDLAKHKKEIVRLIKEAREATRKIKTRGLIAAVDVLEKQIVHQRKYLDVFHTKADSAQRELKKAQEWLAQLQADISLAKRQVDEGEENPHARNLRLVKKRLTSMRGDLDDAKHDQIIQCERELTRAKFWVKGFKDIKLHIIEELLQELELVTAGMLDEVGLVGWEVKYAIERETKRGTVRRGLTVFVRSPESHGLVRWESWSGGESQRLRVVGALALGSVLLSHAGVEPNMEVLDEPTQHLSDEGIYDLCDYLADRAKVLKRRIFYCDHQSVDSARFAGTITVRRDDKGSRVVRVQE
jgi:DNA repair exonuclease SbcCD ATPase subunit